MPLISAAAEVGAEYFCIDAGWYDEEHGWWDSAGDWKPSSSRFPGGLSEVLAHIRAAGMVPGLWMYNRAFYAGEFGYACAIGMIIFVFILALTFINNRYVRVEK